MKTLYSFIISLCLFIAWACTDNHSLILNITREYVAIPMRDGVRLGGLIYKPVGEGNYPAIVYRTPYNIADYDSYAELPLKAAKRGFIAVLVDVRGRYSSEGEFEAYRNEKKDGYDVIEWVADMPGCDGRVVTYGGSYPGIVQWLAMAEQPPSLAAAAPELTPINSHDFFYYGGAFSHAWLDWFMPYILADKRKRAGDDSATWDVDEAEEAWNAMDKKKWYAFRPLDKLPLFGDYAPEYFEWLNHPIQDEWWEFTEVESHFSRFNQPVFLLSGWYDAAYGTKGAIEAFRKISEESPVRARKLTRLILGPWNHTSLNVRKTKFGDIDFGPSAGLDYDKELLDWYDLVLGRKSEPGSLPVVSYFMMGANEWRSEMQWPPKNTVQKSLYLTTATKQSTQKGGLTWEAPKDPGSPKTYIFNPENPFWDVHNLKSIPYDMNIFNNRSDVLVFDSEVLSDELEIAGEVVAELFVSSSGKDTDFSFTLCDVYPDGRSINLAGLDAGYLRMRYRNGSEQEKLLEPGKVYPVSIGSFFTANRFLKNHRIRLIISSSSVPHFNANSNTGNPIASDSLIQICMNSVYLGQDYPSRLVLPVLDTE